MELVACQCVPIREVSSFQRIVYRLQWSWLPEDVSLLERCPHFRGYCVPSVQAINASMNLVKSLMIVVSPHWTRASAKSSRPSPKR